MEKCDIKLDDNQINRLFETLQFHEKGILPASVLKREVGISYDETHKLMIYLATVNILKPVYRIYCENDMETGAGKIYNKLSEIPIKTCDRCDKKCILLESIYVEFKVISCE